MNDKHAYTSDELDARLSHIKKYLGCFAIDALPARLRPGQSLIVNQDRAAGGGTHWMAVASAHGLLAIFDPFGGPPDPRILAMGRASTGKVFANTLQYQPATSSACGPLSAYFIDCIQHHDPYVVLYKDLIPSTSKRNSQVALRWMHSQEGTGLRGRGAQVDDAMRARWGDATKQEETIRHMEEGVRKQATDPTWRDPYGLSKGENDEFLRRLSTDGDASASAWRNALRAKRAKEINAADAAGQEERTRASAKANEEEFRAKMIAKYPEWDSYSEATKRAIVRQPFVDKIAEKAGPVFREIIKGMNDPILAEGIQHAYDFLVAGGIELAKSILKGDPKSAFLQILKKSAPAFAYTFTASHKDPTPAALAVREIAQKIAGGGMTGGKIDPVDWIIEHTPRLLRVLGLFAIDLVNVAGAGGVRTEVRVRRTASDRGRRMSPDEFMAWVRTQGGQGMYRFGDENFRHPTQNMRTKQALTPAQLAVLGSQRTLHGSGRIDAYCMRCKKSTPMLSIRHEVTKNGMAMLRGQCEHCSCNMCKITGKSKA